MNIILFFIVFIALAALYLFVGLQASKKVTSTNDYFLAGRNLGFWSVMFTLLATQIGGGMLLGTAQEAYQVGIYGILYNVSMVIGFFLLGTSVAGRLQSMHVGTTAELFETRYHSITLKKIASLLSIITLCGIFISQIVASKTLLASLKVHNEAIFVGFWLCVITYTMAGGLHAVVVADTYQVVYILSVFSAITLFCFATHTSSFFNNLIFLQSHYFPKVTYNNAHYITTLMMPALFSLIEQDLAQRFFAARTRTIAAMAALCASGGLLLFSLIPIYFGMQAKYLGLSLDVSTNPLIPSIELMTNEYIVIFAVCGIIAAITSTADSLLCAISSNIMQDFILPLHSSGNRLRQSQYITCIIGIMSLIISYCMPRHIINILVNSYALSVNCLLIPLLGAYYLRSVHKKAAQLAIMGGFLGYLITFGISSSIYRELMPLGCSLFGYILGTIWSKRYYLFNQ